MDTHAIEYYTPYSDQSLHGHFHKVIPLHESPQLDWKTASNLSPDLSKGWFELARLSTLDRIEFTREFWTMKLPYQPLLTEFLTKFFASLDDIGIFLTQQKYEDPFSPQLVYSLAGNSGFFHGEHPATDDEIIHLQKEFSNYILPADYLAFLQIHNGFAKLTDTGITPSQRMKETYEEFQKDFKGEESIVTTTTGVPVNPSSLIPFYESFGMPYFQCFWGEWYPEQEMGNIYYSSLTRTFCPCKKTDDCVETMAFRTFIDWLMFYLEKID